MKKSALHCEMTASILLVRVLWKSAISKESASSMVPTNEKRLPDAQLFAVRLSANHQEIHVT